MQLSGQTQFLPPLQQRASQFGPGTPHLLRPHQYLAREAEAQSSIHLIVEGWACRYKLLPDGRRQITQIFLPGDLCEPGWCWSPVASQHVATITNVRTIRYSCRALKERAAGDSLVESMLWSGMMSLADARSEWLINLGRKTALEKLSHLFCELFYRMKAVSLTTANQCAMPLTQVDMADIAGLTPVHVNRTLQEMRQFGLIDLKAKWLIIPNIATLREAGLFYDHYLRPHPVETQHAATN